jgi:hypothetical protein
VACIKRASFTACLTSLLYRTSSSSAKLGIGSSSVVLGDAGADAGCESSMQGVMGVPRPGLLVSTALWVSKPVCDLTSGALYCPRLADDALS